MPFLEKGKAVFNVEYNLGKSMCDQANIMGLDTIVKVSVSSACFLLHSQVLVPRPETPWFPI